MSERTCRWEWKGNSMQCGSVRNAPSGNFPSGPAALTLNCPDHADRSQWASLFEEAVSLSGGQCFCEDCRERCQKNSYRIYTILKKLAGEGMSRVAALSEEERP